MNINEIFLDADGETLLELSLSNLKNNVRRNFGPERDSKSVRTRVVNYQAIPSISDKTLLIKANVVGEEFNYKIQVRFVNVSFSSEPKPGYVEIKAMDGQDYFIKQFTLSQTQAKVQCSCLDFYYRFAIWNHGKNSLEGDPPPPYVKKTDRPPVNPSKTPGACKHIMKVMQFLKGEGIAR